MIRRGIRGKFTDVFGGFCASVWDDLVSGISTNKLSFRSHQTELEISRQFQRMLVRMNLERIAFGEMPLVWFVSIKRNLHPQPESAIKWKELIKSSHNSIHCFYDTIKSRSFVCFIVAPTQKLLDSVICIFQKPLALWCLYKAYLQLRNVSQQQSVNEWDLFRILRLALRVQFVSNARGIHHSNFHALFVFPAEFGWRTSNSGHEAQKSYRFPFGVISADLK